MYLRELRLLQATIIDVDDVDELLRSHHELRATLIVAGRERAAFSSADGIRRCSLRANMAETLLVL